MKRLSYAITGIAFTFAIAAYAHDEQPGMMQRAAANAYEMRNTGPRTGSVQSTAQTVDLGPVRGKHAMQIAESRRSVSSERGLDVVHAPRPITGGKDPNFEAKWRENARQFQVAPVK